MGMVRRMSDDLIADNPDHETLMERVRELNDPDFRFKEEPMARTHARDDEESELVAIDDEESWEEVAGMEDRNVSGSCAFCGNYGHKFADCPVRPRVINDEGKWTTDASGNGSEGTSA